MHLLVRKALHILNSDSPAVIELTVVISARQTFKLLKYVQ